MRRRDVLAFGLASLATSAFAQARYTDRPIRLVVPFSPGASNDAIARVIAPPLGKRLETTVIVENRPGAAGVIGADAVAKSPRDGSVVLLTSSTFLTAAATQPRLPYDPIAAFAPVAIVAQNPSLLAVSAASPFKTTAELTKNFRGSFTYFKGNKLKFGRGASATHPDETTWDQKGPTSVYKAEGDITLSNSTFIAARYARTTGGFSLTPRGGLANVTEAIDLADGVSVPPNSLLIVPFDDGRGIRATDEVLVLVKGAYKII